MLRRALMRCTPSDTRFEVTRNGTLATLHLCRHSCLNAFSLPMCDAIKEVAEEVSKQNSSVRALILTGGPTAFSAGKDLKASLNHTEQEAAHYYNETLGAIKALLNVPIPVIAGIEKVCLGLGLELALTADIRIAGESSRIGFPEINLSIFPGCGGAVLLPLILGNTSIASDLILTGRQIKPHEAKEIGLISRVVPDGTSLTECLTIAESLITKERNVLIKAKEVVRYSVNRELRHGDWMKMSEQYRTELGKSDAHLQALRNFASRKRT